jgi:hypothetical protein
MELMIVGLTSLLFLVVAGWVLRSFRASRCFWLNPLVLPISVWTASYPVWAVVRSTVYPEDSISGLGGIHLETSLLVVLFATLFIALLGVSLRIFVPAYARRLEPMAAMHVSRRESVLIHLVFVVVAGAWLVRFWTGSVFGLYEEFEQLTHSLWENMVGTLAGVVWFALPASLLAYGVSRKWIFLLETLLLIGILLAFAVVSTSKGVLLQIIVCLLVVSSAFRNRYVRITKGSVVLMIAGIAGLILFGVYSYEIRDKAYGAVRGLAGYDVREITDLVGVLPAGEVIGKNLFRVVDRIIGYGDGLARLVEGSADRSNPLYALGSLVEVGNLVPRFVWEGRPHLSFNHHVTSAVWGQYGLLSETPIGRVGEAFYVGGWFGVSYGLLYGALFGLIGLSWARLRKSVWGAACAAAVLLVWVLPDAYLTYNLKQLVVVIGTWRLGLLVIGSCEGLGGPRPKRAAKLHRRGVLPLTLRGGL